MYGIYNVQCTCIVCAKCSLQYSTRTSYWEKLHVLSLLQWTATMMTENRSASISSPSLWVGLVDLEGRDRHRMQRYMHVHTENVPFPKIGRKSKLSMTMQFSVTILLASSLRFSFKLCVFISFSWCTLCLLARVVAADRRNSGSSPRRQPRSQDPHLPSRSVSVERRPQPPPHWPWLCCHGR